MPAFSYVDQPDRITAQIEAHDPLAVDTEFMRERTYFSQLCLVQLATPDEIFCVDPLGGHDLGGFWEALDGRTWGLHSARQDIEVLYQTSQRMPAGIFDTQIAAALLGYQAQLGYAALVAELFDVQLPKSHTRANWAKRPLGDDILQYAAEDVEYLLPAQDILAERLDKKGRLDWALADSAALLNPALYDIDPARAIDRLKGARNLRGQRRVVAARLAAWREREALRLDRPRQWILRDAAVMDMASRLPGSPAELARIDGVAEKLVRRSGADLLAEISAAADDAHDYVPPKPPSEAQKNLLKRMLAVVAECAADLDIAAELIASRKDLTAVVMNSGRDSRVLNGWRKDLLGDRLAALL